MAYRIYRLNNYIFALEDGRTVPLKGGVKDVYVNQTGDGSIYTITGLNAEIQQLPLEDILKEDGSPYSEAEWLDFYTNNTKSFNSGTNPPVVSAVNGFIDYNDATGSINLTADIWTDIPNDGEGSFTNKTYAPDGVTEFMDVTTGYIDVTELDLGDTILIRNDYVVNPNTNNTLLEFRYELGDGAGIYNLETIKSRLDSGSGQDYRFSLQTDLIYLGDTNTRDNPIKLQAKLSSSGTLTNAGSVIQLIRRS